MSLFNCQTIFSNYITWRLNANYDRSSSNSIFVRILKLVWIVLFSMCHLLTKGAVNRYYLFSNNAKLRRYPYPKDTLPPDTPLPLLPRGTGTSGTWKVPQWPCANQRNPDPPVNKHDNHDLSFQLVCKYPSYHIWTWVVETLGHRHNKVWT